MNDRGILSLPVIFFFDSDSDFYFRAKIIVKMGN